MPGGRRFVLWDGSATQSVTPPAAEALIHGQLLVVSGAGFGTRGDFNIGNYTWQGQRHLHYRWTDFSTPLPPSGSPLADIRAALQGWDVQTVGEVPTSNYAAEGASIISGGPSRSGQMFRVDGRTRQGGLLTTSESVDPIPTNVNAYAAFYMRRSPSNVGKTFRWVWGSGNSNFYLSVSGLFTETGWPANWGGGAFWKAGALSSSSFERVELHITNGATRIFRNGTLATWDNSTMRGNGFADQTVLPAPPAGTSSRGIRISLPNSVSSTEAGIGSTTDTADLADVYLDFTPQRVEVVQGSNVAVQPLTAWSDTSISCVGNAGNLSSGAATLRVIGADNAVISSQPITVT